VTDCSIVERGRQPVAVVRGRVAASELPRFFDRAFGTVWAQIQAQDVGSTGEAIGIYPSAPGAMVEVEAGFPTERPITPVGEVVASELPGGRIATALHVGSYETLDQTYADLLAWVRAQGLTPGQMMWESYLSDPRTEPDPAKWRTRIYLSVS
jgi:effector-binding domain-containing protein